MATFLDVTGLQHFSNLFAFIFVWLVVYALLSYTRALGNNQLIHALIGLIIGLFALFSPVVTGAIIFIAPWFALVFVFAMLIMVVGNMFGVGSGISSYPTLRGIILTLLIIVFVVGILVYARDQMSVPEEITEKSDFSKITNVIFHPKFMGMVFILIIAVFTIGLLASKSV
jgi:hypothetical protein